MGGTMSKTSVQRELYADVIAAGGLVTAVQQALHRNDSSLVATGIAESRFPTYARVEREARFSQIFIAAEERLFLFDLWRDGVMYGNGQTPDIDEMATAIDHWIGRCVSVAEIGQLECVKLTESASVYDEGCEVEHRWKMYLSDADPFLRELMPFIRLAAQQPVLRRLFPYASHSTFCFSRCTGYPFSFDCPNVTPIATGQFRVAKPGGHTLGTGDAEAAVSLVLGNLPPDCGPAIRGTSDKLNAR